MTQPELVDYYRARAPEYEQVYAKPERQADLAQLHALVPTLLAARRVLEVACGTGYWTRRIAARATAITACDLVPETLAVAQAQQPVDLPVTFVIGDAFDLDAIAGSFDAGFAGFWWSHLLHADIQRFLRGFHRRLTAEARVVLIDNCYVDGSNYPITRVDASGNTYQQRQLNDGTPYEVLKNFPSAVEIEQAVVAAGGEAITVTTLEHYWCATYTVGLAA